MAEARKWARTELVAHFVEHFAAVNISLKRADAREFFEELQRLCEQQLSGLRRVHAARHRESSSCRARSADRSQPRNGGSHRILPKQVVKARIAKQLKDAVLPEA